MQYMAGGVRDYLACHQDSGGVQTVRAPTGLEDRGLKRGVECGAHLARRKWALSIHTQS